MDVAGRVSRATESYEYATAGGFTLETDKINKLRENLPKNLPKWKTATISDIKKVSNYICENVIFCSAVCLDKNTEQWPIFWENAETYHQKLASASKMRTGYVKAANVIRYWLFGQCAAPLLAETIKKIGKPKIFDPHGLGIIEVDIVCHSDIQGHDNIEAFKSCWEQFEKSQEKTNQLGLRIMLKDVKILSEQDKPLILIADYIAGICNALFGAGKVSAPDSLDLDDIKTELDKINDTGKILVIGEKFNLAYKDIFTNFEAI